MTNQVADDYSMARNTERLPRKTENIRGLQVMHEQRATNYVEAVVAKRKSQRIAANRGYMPVQMSGSPIQQDRLQLYTFTPKGFLSKTGDVARGAGDIQPRDRFQSSLYCYLVQQARHGLGSAEPPIDHSQIFE
jgi:hypothetical protein